MDLTAGKLTAARLMDSWLRLVSTYDQVLGNETYRRFLHSQVVVQPTDSVFSALEARRANAPEFFVQHDYTWASDPTAYSRPVEAAFQVRALDAAIGLWSSGLLDPSATKHLERIAVRSTYMGRLKEATPVVRHFEDIAFIICPMAWPEALEWFFAGLCAYAGADSSTSPEAAWGKFVVAERNTHAATRHVLSLIANLVASADCAHDVLMPQAVSAICNQVPAFKDALPELQQSAQSSVSKDLAYLGVEMALCHEVGHIVRGDHLPGVIADESAADTLGLIAFVGSWDWRHFCLDGLLGNIGRLTLAVAAYWHFLPAFYSVAKLVSRAATESAGPDDDEDRHLEALMARGADVMRHLDLYLAQGRTKDLWPERAVDTQHLKSFFATMGAYQQHLIQVTRQLPVAALRHGTHLAAEQRAG